MVRVEESIDGDMVIPAHFDPKDPSEYNETEKEKVSLDIGLQLILIESFDNYEGFMAKPRQRITKVFERFNKLINDLQLHDKYYEAEEVNLNFLLALPDHIEQKISAIREGRDLSRITWEVLYGILKTYELEMMQRKSLKAYHDHVVDGSSGLIVNDREESEDGQVPVVQAMEQKNKGPQKQVVLELKEDEYYTLDEVDEIDQSMAYLARNFFNIRVKKPRFFKSKGQSFNNNNWKPKAQYNSTRKGLTYLVYPGAVHSRFEHSLGVHWLAGETIRKIKNDQGSELGIDVVDIQAVGHGPFGHMFEKEFIPVIQPGW
ncbi:hypothetical protein AgCh_010501 [Apium graveolens]